jgi:hypothetical protein
VKSQKAVDDVLGLVDRLVPAGMVGGLDPGDHAVDVAARGEGLLARAGEDDDRRLRVVVDVGEDARQLVVHAGRHGVERRVVEGDPQDPAAALDLQGLIALVHVWSLPGGAA